MRRFLLLAGCLSVLALTACSGDSSLPEATGKGSLRAINAIETSPEFVFLIEERRIDSVGYKQASSSASWDDLSYTFSFDVLFFGDTTRTRVASMDLDVVANKDYTFVISGAVAAPTITLWEGDQREWAEGATETEFRFGHLATTEDSVDVYLAAPGVAPVDGAEIGSLAFGEVLPAIDMTAGEYVVTVTAAGDETDILFLSNSFITAAATSLLVSIFDGDANDVSSLAVHAFNTTSGGTAPLTDSRSMPTIRFFHASKDQDLVDIYIEDLTTMPAPFIDDHAFRDVTDDIEVPTGILPLAYTTPLDTMTIYFQNELTINPGLRWDMFFFGPAGSPQVIVSRADRRSIETIAKVSLLQAASNHETTDLYIVDRGVDISTEDVLPSIIGIVVNGIALSTPRGAGSYDYYLTTRGEKTVVAGPFELDVVLGDVVQLIAYDVDDTAFAEIVAIPPPAPAPPP